MADPQKLPVSGTNKPKKVSMRKGRWSTSEKLMFR